MVGKMGGRDFSSILKNERAGSEITQEEGSARNWASQGGGRGTEGTGSDGDEQSWSRPEDENLASNRNAGSGFTKRNSCVSMGMAKHFVLPGIFFGFLS